MKKLMKYMLSVLILLIGVSGRGQTFEWAKGIDGTGGEEIVSFTNDTSGNIFLTGAFNGTPDFDPGPSYSPLTAGGYGSAYISKYNASGDMLWAKGVIAGGAFSFVYGNAVITDAIGNSYMAGMFFNGGTVDYDPGPGTVTGTSPSGFILKLDPSGNFISVKEVPANGNCTDILLDASGNMYVLGYFFGTSDFDPGPGVYNLTSAGEDVFVLKLDAAGNFVWARSIGGTTNDRAWTFAIQSTGDIWIGGDFQSATDFDPGAGTFTLTPISARDGFILVLNSSGNFVRALAIAGNGEEFVNDIEIDAWNKVYVAGNFSGTSTDFNPGAGTYSLSNTASPDAYILRLSPSGSFRWVNAYGSSLSSTVSWIDEAKAIQADNYGNVYVGGNFGNTIDFDPGAGVSNLTSTTMPDVFVQKLDSLGNQIWVRQIVGTGEERIQAMKLSSAGELLLGGYHTGTADCDPSASAGLLSCSGGIDGFFTKWDVCAHTSASFAANACDSYTSPGGKVWATSGSYNDTIMNAAGCDSILTINLTVNSSTSETIFATACDSYTLNGITYPMSGTHFQFTTNAAGCDSIITLELTINNSSSSAVTATACDSYTLNGISYTSGGTYTQNLTTTAGCDSTLTLNLTLNSSTTETVTATACGSYTLNSMTYTTSGTYAQTLTNAAGCDSTLTLNLTINNTDISVTQVDSMLTATATPATFQWINCATGLPVPGATSATFIPAASGSYAVIVTQSGCTDTSACYPVILMSAGTGVEENAVRVYPVPASSLVTVDLGGYIGQTFIRLVNLNGAVMKETEVNSTSTANLDLSAISSGLYLLEIRREGYAAEWVKVVKE